MTVRHHATVRRRPRGPRQSGAVLFVALILLLILSLLAVSAARLQTVEERMARNENNRQVGAAAAEGALRQVEAGLQSGVYPTCGTGIGLYCLASEITADNGSVLTAPTFSWTDPTQVLTYTGPALSAVPTVPAPKYIIETLPSVVGRGNKLNGSKARPVYRVTVQAVGADQTSTTTVQSIVHY